jgi:hypothetical protein
LNPRPWSLKNEEEPTRMPGRGNNMPSYRVREFSGKAEKAVFLPKHVSCQKRIKRLLKLFCNLITKNEF